MPLTLHSHSGQFCNHAAGSLDQVVAAAKARGYRVLGLSEHVPRSRPQDLYPEEAHLSPEHLADLFDTYVVEARAHQRAAGPDMVILVGAETEYIYPEQAEEILRLRHRHALDYLIGSLHHVNGIPIDYSPELYDQAVASAGGSDLLLFAAYFDAQYDMLRALHPEVVGHLDLIRIFRPSATFPSHIIALIRRNIAYAVDYGALFEINPRALKKGLPTPYPSPDIIAMIAELDGKFTLGDDSHGPEDIAMFYDILPTYLTTNNVTSLYYPTGRSKDRIVSASILSDNAPSDPFWQQYK